MDIDRYTRLSTGIVNNLWRSSDPTESQNLRVSLGNSKSNREVKRCVSLTPSLFSSLQYDDQSQHRSRCTVKRWSV